MTAVKLTRRQRSSQTEGRIKAHIWNIYRLQDTGAEEEEGGGEGKKKKTTDRNLKMFISEAEMFSRVCVCV